MSNQAKMVVHINNYDSTYKYNAIGSIKIVFVSRNGEDTHSRIVEFILS